MVFIHVDIKTAALVGGTGSISTISGTPVQLQSVTRLVTWRFFAPPIFVYFSFHLLSSVVILVMAELLHYFSSRAFHSRRAGERSEGTQSGSFASGFLAS